MSQSQEQPFNYNQYHGINGEYGRPSPEWLLRAFVERTAISSKGQPSDMTGVVACRRELTRHRYNPNDDVLALEGSNYDPRSQKFGKWSLLFYRENRPTYAVSPQGDVARHEDEPQYIFEIENRHDEYGKEQVFQRGSDIPLGPEAVYALRKRVDSYRWLGETNYSRMTGEQPMPPQEPEWPPESGLL